MSAKQEIDTLANFIMAEVDGEPSQSEGAGTTAIRIIREQQAKLEAAGEALGAILDSVEAGKVRLDIYELELAQRALSPIE